MERPLLIISIRKKKLIQWLRFSHIGNPEGSADVSAGILKAGTPGSPVMIYCNHAAPVGTSKKMAKIIFIYGLTEINTRLSVG